MRLTVFRLLPTLVFVALAGCKSPATSSNVTTSSEWTMHGGDFGEQRDGKGQVGVVPSGPGSAVRGSACVEGRGTVRGEGVPQKQAVATALNMDRKNRLTASGGYIRAGKKRGAF